MNEAFGPVWAEMMNRRFLVVERFIGRRLSYGSVRDSVSKINSGCDSFCPSSHGNAGQQSASSGDNCSVVSFGNTI